MTLQGQSPAQPGGNFPAKANENGFFNFKLTLFCPACGNL
jgi:hypothetical protein